MINDRLLQETGGISTTHDAQTHVLALDVQQYPKVKRAFIRDIWIHYEDLRSSGKNVWLAD